MHKIGRNDPCPCGSGKKYKKCCLNKKPREQIVMVGSPEPLRGVHYNKEKMELTGLTIDGRLIKPFVTFSQTQYKGETGKEKVLSRIHDKVISGVPDLLRHLSSFDLIISADTNSKTIGGEVVYVSGIVYSIVQRTSDLNVYQVEFPWHGVSVFRNCPEDLPAEKFGWMTVMKELNRHPENDSKRFVLVTDHDLDSHDLYNKRKLSIFRDFYSPPNFTLMYGRGDGSIENPLNYLVKMCDKESTKVLKQIETNGYFHYGDIKLPIDKIPVPAFA